ncbi:MAG: EAL domain-containing protein, partial [Acidobacteria bacterium]|nr:EAL domain-containing protein [Acidobacteriota bacterium]
MLSGKIPGFQIETRCLHRDGHVVWVLWSVSQAIVEHSESAHLIFQIQNIADRKAAEERLLHDAFHDALTELPNRALMMDHLRLAIARNKRRPQVTFAVLYLDLDRFKVVNDSFGHMIGDQLLVGIAHRLEACVRPGDTVARVGGDEFTILLEDLTDVSEAVSVAERIQQELKLPFKLSGRDVFTTVSVGIAPGSNTYNQPDEILRDADTAMYRSKSLGKARHELFDEEMQARTVNLLQMENDLRRAFEQNEFYVNYQPIVALDDFRLCGFEALVRWQHPARGLISPAEFIPIAEESGQILQIGEWVLREACYQLESWQKKFPSDKPLYMTVNLSAKQFAQPDLVDRVRGILTETNIEPAFLKLEITESVVMDNIDSAAAMLAQLRALGVRLSIDDFGTGYSSLTYLHQFPIDTLKIDRSFIDRLDKENVEIVRTVLMLAENLGMDAVAEGVETQEQMTL